MKSTARLIRSIGTLLLGVPGLMLLLGGAKLVALGGSLYYLLAGVALLASAVLTGFRNTLAVWIYGVLMLGTIVWALAEVGLDTWGLLPRLWVFVLLGLWFTIPSVHKTFADGSLSLRRARALLCACGAVLLGLVLLLIVNFHHGPSFISASAVPSSKSIASTRDNDWQLYGNTAGGDRFSPADQITPLNANKLELAWSFRTGVGFEKGSSTAKALSFQATPIKVGNALFICTPGNVLFSLDVDTGKALWRFDPQVGPPPWPACRGVSYVPGKGSGSFCDSRILMATLDNRLHAVDVATGKHCPDFGNGGVVDLTEGMGDNPPWYYTTSPPVIAGHIAVLGGGHLDNQSNNEPPGVVRAFDVHSGKLLWAWEVLEPSSRHSLGPGETYARNTANAWTVFSADVDNGLIFVPTGGPPPDYYGGLRSPAQQRYSNSIVALDMETGNVRWSFQTSHHDLWDLDNPSQPVVIDLDLATGRRPALIVPTKRGEIFVLDRLTGQPLFGVEERPAPQSPIQGERLSPTQPYPIGFPSFSPPHLTEADMWGATPFDQLLCRIEFRKRRYDGQFTPPSLQGSIGYPDFYGVFNWGSVAVDPERQLMFINPSWLPYLTRLIPRAEADALGIVPISGRVTHSASIPSAFAQAGTPYAVTIKPFLSPLGFPCHRPPWGAVAVIDLKLQKILWEHPFGTTRDVAPLGLPFATGVFSLGGAVVTRGGVAFIGAAIDNYLRAFDITTGRELWRGRLPAGGQATPMTYVSSRTGRQYVVIAAGGHAALQTQQGDYVVAYALPK